jgi:signal peptidase I
MTTTLLRKLRRTVGFFWVALLLILLGLVGVNTLGPKLGYQIFIIRGSSMSPAIPLGSLVAVQHTDATTLAVGDVVSIQTSTGVIYTHRIVAIDTTGPEPQFQLRGDANATPDSEMVPASALVGRVSAYAPWLGYVTALLSMPTGIISILSMLASLLLGFWTLEDLERELELEPEAQPAPTPELVPGVA